MTQFYPPDRLDPSFRRAFAAACPDLLLVWHPAFHEWQAYESREGQWDAERLYHAILSHNAHKRGIDWKWWRWRGSPKLAARWLRPWVSTPLIDALRSYRMDDYPGGHRQWVRDYENEETEKQAKDEARVSEFHKDVALSGLYRHARDFVRGDPLAGKRRWVRDVPVSLRCDDSDTSRVTRNRVVGARKSTRSRPSTSQRSPVVTERGSGRGAATATDYGVARGG